jgi:hypothetical protein
MVMHSIGAGSNDRQLGDLAKAPLRILFERCDGSVRVGDAVHVACAV